MKENSPEESTVEEMSTFTQFLNLTGDISRILYLTMHPEENDEVLPIVVKNEGDNKFGANARTIHELPTAA